MPLIFASGSDPSDDDLATVTYRIRTCADFLSAFSEEIDLLSVTEPLGYGVMYIVERPGGNAMNDMTKGFKYLISSMAAVN